MTSSLSGSLTQVSTSGRRCDEALILDQPRRPSRAQLDRTRTIGNRVRGIGDVAVECRRGRSPAAGRTTAFPSPENRAVAPTTLRFGGHASCSTHSFAPVLNVSASGRSRLPLSLQVVGEERRQHVAPIVLPQSHCRSRCGRACALRPSTSRRGSTGRRRGSSASPCRAARAARRS